MENALFVFALGLGFGLLLVWSFKTLPGEKWQIFASVPVAKEGPDRWRGVNLTYYGLLNALAYAAAAALMLVLLGSISVPALGIFMVAAAILACCVPASTLVARLVEKKPCTFTVGGASFVGVVIAPWVIEFINGTLGRVMDLHIPVIPALAALSISYALGEGTGRLACISFGCCYGKPLSKSHPVIRKLFENRSFTFFGKTKKIAYASGMDGEKVIPVQAITSMLYIGAGVVGVSLFLQSKFQAAFALSVLITQVWRVLSEMLRADYRGEGRVSAYQVMGVAAAVYAMSLPLVLPSVPLPPPDLMAGLRLIWNPLPLLLIQALAFLVFMRTGRSMVTGSFLSFHVIRERI